MPTSSVIQVMREKQGDEKSKVKFSSEDVLLEIPADLDKVLGSPVSMRIRIEDMWNDPNRTWE